MIVFDTETVGFTGPLVTIQYLLYDEVDHHSTPVRLYKVWEHTVNETLELIDWFCVHGGGVCGFNLVFDWFQLTKWYNVLRCVNDRSKLPIPEEVRRLESIGPNGPTVSLALKPHSACDLMLLARTGKYQYLSKHKPFIIKKIPSQLIGWFTDGGLEDVLSMPSGVSIRARESQSRSQRNDVRDIVVEFDGLSTRLKHLYSIITGTPQTGQFAEEVGIAPYQDEPDWKPWGGDWLYGLRWLRRRFEDKEAQDYAIRDVHYTFELWKSLGRPPCGDDDSELACLVGASHWRGFAVDVESVNVLLDRKLKEQKVAPTSPSEVYYYLQQYLNETEQLLLTDTKKSTLEEFARWENHLVQEPAKKVIQSRQAQSRCALLKKLKAAGSLNFSMKVSGALSSRMSGDSGMNAQGIPREQEIRSLFPLAFATIISTQTQDNSDGDGPTLGGISGNETLEGGDFDAFEISIADAVYQDPQLRKDLTGGKKVHGIIGSEVWYEGETYDHILGSKGTGINDRYVRSKNGLFGWIYGAHEKKLANVLDISLEEAQRGLRRLKARYTGVVRYREGLASKFMPLTQEGGRGSKLSWSDPVEYCESILGFKRWFSLEYATLQGLYNLAESCPSSWKHIPGEIRRVDRVQTVEGAARSALYSAIFSLQGHIFRAAANHEIQSPGGQITKHLQRRIWDLQPVGIEPWKVRPMNVHDEIMCPRSSDLGEGTIKDVVDSTVESFRDRIPLIKMEWKSGLKTWGDK